MARGINDLDWVEPLLDEARAEVARGVVLSLDKFNEEVDKFRAEV